MTGEASRINTDFYITYHHSDEMAARWIAAVLKQARFSTLSDSWDFLPGEAPIKKIEYMFTAAQNVMVLISGRFLHSNVDLTKSFGKSRNPFSKGFLVAEGKVIIIRIEVCDIESILGPMEYLDLAGIDAKEAEKRLLAAVGGAQADHKETEPLPGSAGPREELLAQRKQEMDQLLDSTIKHNYHMKLDLEQEVLKEVEVKNERTGEMEKWKEWVWESVPLDTVLKDGKNYILVNPSGLGKTTFLTYAACALLDQEANYPFLPIFFTCIGLNNRTGTIEDFIRRQVDSVYTGTQGSLVSGEWENLCILIDALDQARDVDDIVSSLLLHDKPLHYKKAKIILSSRQNTADKVKESFAKIRLKLPVADEVRLYLGEENYQKLAGIIEASGELVKAPVLLEMLKTITEKGHVVSTLTNRADLYTEFTKVLLDQERSKPRFWQDRLAIRHFIDFELEQVLEKMAFFSLADNEILEIPKEKLAQYCESPEKKEALLNIGILLELFEDREQKIVFRHQSFQAYFAARYIYNQQPGLFRELVGDIAFFYSDVWYEVMRFFVGLEKNTKKAGAIIEAILNTDKGINVFKKINRRIKRWLKKYDLTGAVRLIFAFFLMSETQVSIEFIQRIYEQMLKLLKNYKKIFIFFNSNTDKFNKSNDKQRRNLFIIFEPMVKSKDINVRKDAVEALGKIGTAEYVHFLEPLLRAKEWSVRNHAVEALEKIGTSKDIPFLEPLLRDKEGYVRLTSTEGLGKIGTSDHVPLLEPLLRDKEWYVRSAATKVLEKIGTAKDIPLLESLLRDESVDVRRAAAKVLEKILEKIDTAKDIPLLESLLRDKEGYVRHAAAEALGKICTAKDIPLLESLLRDKDYLVRHAAFDALEKIGSSDNIPLLVPLLRDEDSSVRRAAAEALGKIGTSKHVPILKPLIRDEDSSVRCAAAEALGKIGTSKHVPILRPLLRDENYFVCGEAVRALGEIGTAQDIPLLESTLRDKEWLDLSKVAEALGKMGTVKDIPLLEPLLRAIGQNERRAAAEALGKIVTAKDIHLLEPLLRDKHEDVRLAAMEVLGKIGTSDHIPLLEPLLRDKRDVAFYVRRAAVETLGKIGTSQDIPLLNPFLRDESVDVRSAAARALGKIGTSKHVPILRPLLRDENYFVCGGAVSALGKIGNSDHIPLLKPLLRDKEEYVRSAAVETLGKIGTVKNIPILAPLLGDKDEYVRRNAPKAIETIYKRSTPKLRLDRIFPKKDEEKVLLVKLFSSQSLHILHISDIHYALKNDPTITCIFHEFLEDIKKWRAQQNHTKIQTICLTGDIAASGEKEQYEAIHEKINAILETSGCPQENLFIIPGNHDVQEYDRISPQGKTLLEQVRDNKINVDTGVLSSADHYRLFHDKFDNYYKFIEKYGYLSSLPDNRLPIPDLPNPWFNRKLKDFPVRIMGLNSALFCLKGYIEYGKIRMGTHQFQEAYFQGKGLAKGKAGDRRDPEVVILLTHHPLNWLAESEYDDYSTLMERYAVLHLHGHIHKTHIEKKQRLFSSSGGYVSIGTGSLYGEKGKEDINTYHIITLDFESQEVHVWARRWNPDTGKWTVYDDDGNNRFRLPVKR